MNAEKDRELDRLAFEFLKLFARYEYALKMMGYVGQYSNGNIFADWDRFANEVGRCILDEPSTCVKEAIEYLYNKPPKRQVLKNGLVEWEEVNASERSAQILFRHIRRVRNNLFHGGKFNGRWFAPDRSETLMRHSITVLKALISKNDNLKQALDNNVPYEYD